MVSQTKILIWVAIAGIIAFTLWRNYGVMAKGSVILDTAFGKDNDKTNEQKELIQKIHSSYTMNSSPSEGDKLKTSFGFYRYNNGAWIKYAEIWNV